MKRILYILVLAAAFGGCKDDETYLDKQRTSFESYLSRTDFSYTTPNGVYRYVANADREGYDREVPVEYGDSVSFDFAAYLFSSSIGALYYTNVKEWIPAKDLEVLNPEYWDFSTRRIKLGSASLVKGLEYGLVNSRQNDSLLLFMTSDLVYGTENMGVVNPDQPVVWAVKIKKVVKP